MALSCFDDPATPPAADRLRGVLGSAAPLWDDVVARVGAAHGPVEQQWHFAGAKFGWSMRVRRGDRVLAYLIPGEREFLAGVVLGEAAVASALAAGLPDPVVAALEAAPRHAEGRGLRLPVRTTADAGAIVALVAAKVTTTVRTSAPTSAPTTVRPRAARAKPAPRAASRGRGKSPR